MLSSLQSKRKKSKKLFSNFEQTSNANKSSQEILFLSRILERGSDTSTEGPSSTYIEDTLLFRLKTWRNSVLIPHSSLLFGLLLWPLSRINFSFFQFIGYDFPVIHTLVPEKDMKTFYLSSRRLKVSRL